MTRPLELALTFPCAQNHTFTYDEPIKVESVTQAVCDLALRFGEGADEEEASMVRRFSLLPCSFVLTLRFAVPAVRCCSSHCRLRSERWTSAVTFLAYAEALAELTRPSPSSYHADPSGTFMRYDAKAIGSGSEGAQNELQDSYNKVRFSQHSFSSAVRSPSNPCSR